MIRRLLLPCLAALTSISTAQIHPASFDHQAVVSDSMLASRVGADILSQGGNAVDAAVATAFALAVTYPEAGNIGGGGFMLVRMASGDAVAIDYREVAPKSASRDMYLDAAGKVIPNMSLIGRKAAGVPGTVAGLWEAHRAYGKLEWRTLLEPAIRLAREGFPLTEGRAAEFKSEARQFEKFADSYRIFNRGGKFFAEGEVWTQPDLAKTLERVSDQGRDGFYAGETARLIDADSRKNGGHIFLEDLTAYKAVIRRPIVGTYRGYEIVTMPPPSSGGAALIQMLNMVETVDLKTFQPGSARYCHQLVETMKRAFADRAEHMGDPDFVTVPVAEITDKAYAQSLAAGIRPDRATPSAGIKAGAFGKAEGENTTHFSIVDGEGNCVSNTFTLNTGYGARVVAEGTGFLLNNEMDDFTSKVGVPNGFGLIQGAANAIGPGKRPLSSMTPTIVTRDDKPVLVVGSPGGPTIINTVFQTILNVLDNGMNVQEAVAAPRIHHQWLPDEIRWEPRGLNADTRAKMQEMGHVFAATGGYMGSCHAIWIDPANGKRRAGVDPRLPEAGAAGG
jgi:gamma-glutamyltranspeptidase/glutathione hydrolase